VIIVRIVKAYPAYVNSYAFSLFYSFLDIDSKWVALDFNHTPPRRNWLENQIILGEAREKYELSAFERV
jgi:hypothetical protein